MDGASIGRTVASKLIARKRPRLFPIYDRVIGEVLDTKQAHLEPVRTALRADDGALQRRLVSLREQAGWTRRFRRYGSSRCSRGCSSSPRSDPATMSFAPPPGRYQ